VYDLYHDSQIHKLSLLLLLFFAYSTCYADGVGDSFFFAVVYPCNAITYRTTIALDLFAHLIAGAHGKTRNSHKSRC
jgi:hypothetical protein